MNLLIIFSFYIIKLSKDSKNAGHINNLDYFD